MGIKPYIDLLNNLCARCYPANETPTMLKLFVSGVEKSPNFPMILQPPPNGYADLWQSSPDCEWTGSGGNIFDATINWLIAESRVRVKVSGAVFGFAQTVVDVCETWFENAQQNPAVFAYNFGHAFITTPSQIQSWIELAMPVVGPDPRFELFPMADRQIVIRFANKHENTNMKLRLDV